MLKKVGSILHAQGASDDLLHDLVSTGVDTGDASIEVGTGNGVFQHIAVAAVELHALVDYPLLQIRRPPLCHSCRLCRKRAIVVFLNATVHKHTPNLDL